MVTYALPDAMQSAETPARDAYGNQNSYERLRMRRIAAACAAALILSAAEAALADDQGIDVAQIRCAQLLQSDDKAKSFMMSWIVGYLSAKNNNTVMSSDYMAKLGTYLETYCGENPDTPVLDAAGQMK